ncbi:MAG: TetR/AcrR family transcriptional regulator [Oscillospiraceae bacterium]|nr:TetR/AcrR family transcriptional regulator [Oscillospiraceae bacterium]
MNTYRAEIINAAIDLFAEYGISNVPIKMIAVKIPISRSNFYYYFKSKNDVIDSIINEFDGMIARSISMIKQQTETGIDAESLLTRLFLAFGKEDSQRGRKITRIIFANHGYDERIGNYLKESFFHEREARISCIFDMLVTGGKVKPLNTETAARMLNKFFIASALEDTFEYPFEKHEKPQCLNCLRKDCLYLIKKILSGEFET